MWIKPSFLGMMYRCGYATKPGQERALANSCLSHDDGRPGWAERLRRSPMRIQWDPERGLRHEARPYRSIQVG